MSAVHTVDQPAAEADADADRQLRTPVGRVAAGTHPEELHRLALQEASHPSCDPLAVQATVWLLRACNAVLTSQSDELRPLGLSPSAYNVLMALHNTEDHILEPCQLAERLLISRPSITGLLDTLQGKGFVERRPHPEDGRRVLVALTQRGTDVLRQHFGTHYAEQRAIFADLDEDDLEQLVTLLRRVRGAMPSTMAG
jgi:DNA-binding MarR family transcriptional regulator